MMRDANPKRDELLEAFWEKGLILLGDRVRQEYALRTPIFIDLRHKLYDDLGILCSLGQALHRKLASVVTGGAGPNPRPQQVIGIPDTATPLALAAAVASRSSSFPLIYGQMRKKPAAYPGGEWGVSSFMGTKDPCREITLIDDVMASGRSKLWAMEQLEKDGLEVKRILVVVNREQGGDAILEARGRRVYSLFKISKMLHYFVATGKVDSETAQKALDHLRARQFR